MPGFRVGGPVVIPRLFDGRDKAFFFFNCESFLWPNQIARTRYLLNTSAQQGLFTYPAADGSGLKTIDVLALAASKGQASQKDPIVAKVLADIRSAAAGWSAGGLASWDLNNDKFDYSPSGEETRHAPTLRLDVNLARNHRLTLHRSLLPAWSASPDFLNNREPKFPGFANFAARTTTSYETQAAVRSAFGASLVNEARVGYVGGTTEFGREVGASQFDCSGLGCQGGYNLLIGNYAVGTNALTPGDGHRGAEPAQRAQRRGRGHADVAQGAPPGQHGRLLHASHARRDVDGQRRPWHRPHAGPRCAGLPRLHRRLRQLPWRDQRHVCHLRQEPVCPPHRHGEPGQRTGGSRQRTGSTGTWGASGRPRA